MITNLRLNYSHQSPPALSSSPTIHCFAYQQIHFQIEPEHSAGVGCGHVSRVTCHCLASRCQLSGFDSLQSRVTRVTLHSLSHFRLSNKSTGNPSVRADTLVHLPTSLTTLHHPSIISMINISIVQYSHYFPPQLLIAIGSTIQNLIHGTTDRPAAQMTTGHTDGHMLVLRPCSCTMFDISGVLEIFTAG